MSFHDRTEHHPSATEQPNHEPDYHAFPQHPHEPYYHPHQHLQQSLEHTQPSLAFDHPDPFGHDETEDSSLAMVMAAVVATQASAVDPTHDRQHQELLQTHHASSPSPLPTPAELSESSGSHRRIVTEKTSIACRRCRAQKLKCLGGTPCPRCAKQNVGDSCEYAADVKRRGISKKKEAQRRKEAEAAAAAGSLRQELSSVQQDGRLVRHPPTDIPPLSPSTVHSIPQLMNLSPSGQLQASGISADLFASAPAMDSTQSRLSIPFEYPSGPMDAYPDTPFGEPTNALAGPSSLAAEVDPSKAVRTSIACHRCRKQKLRCLGLVGEPCPRCRKQGVGHTCTYVAHVRRRGKSGTKPGTEEAEEPPLKKKRGSPRIMFDTHPTNDDDHAFEPPPDETVFSNHLQHQFFQHHHPHHLDPHLTDRSSLSFPKEHPHPGGGHGDEPPEGFAEDPLPFNIRLPNTSSYDAFFASMRPDSEVERDQLGEGVEQLGELAH